MPTIPTKSLRRLEAFLDALAPTHYPNAQIERRETRKIWRVITNAYRAANRPVHPIDFAALESALIWRVQMLRQTHLTLFCTGTYADPITQENHTTNSLQTPHKVSTNSLHTPHIDPTNTPPLITKNYADAQDRFQKTIQYIIDRITAPQLPSTTQPNPEINLHDLLAPIIIKGDAILEEHY